jgi:hypothetical protein
MKLDVENRLKISLLYVSFIALKIFTTNKITKFILIDVLLWPDRSGFQLDPIGI